MDASLTSSDLGRLFSNSQGLVPQLQGSDRGLILQKEMQIIPSERDWVEIRASTSF
jgi:hypothetical protein